MNTSASRRGIGPSTESPEDGTGAFALGADQCQHGTVATSPICGMYFLQVTLGFSSATSSPFAEGAAAWVVGAGALILTGAGLGTAFATCWGGALLRLGGAAAACLGAGGSQSFSLLGPTFS